MALSEQARLKEHNAVKNRFTKGHLPWKIIYTEKHPDWLRQTREKYLKSAAGKKWLIKFLSTWLSAVRKDVLVPCLTASRRQGIQSRAQKPRQHNNEVFLFFRKDCRMCWFPSWLCPLMF